ncbi:MAG: hypothetical protein KF757_14405 [Phycisphaeraceae bacterium]|nr:hypothetical protein [Phycisphaeraceae bacterium]MCW5762940.1 hypothetical protein [Phycisphaeraceae bacterium]
MIDPAHIAQLEECRQALGVAEIADLAEPIMGGMMSFTAPGSWTNQACGMAIDGPVTDADLDRLVEFYVSRGCAPRVELCPFADKTLIEGLAARGFVLADFETVLARSINLGAGDLALACRPPEGIEIRRIDPGDPAQVDQWIRVSSSGFIQPDSAGFATFYEASRRVAVHPRMACFIAVQSAQVVGAGGVEVASPLGTDSIACLVATSVLPDFRRRGVQQALISARLAHAREQGAIWATIQSKPRISTERNARRLGFETAYTKCVLVLRRPDLIESP